jgi:hypothetical protein
MNHHPHALRRYSVASLVTGQVGHFWKAGPGQFSKVPKWWGCSQIGALKESTTYLECFDVFGAYTALSALHLHTHGTRTFNPREATGRERIEG